MQPIVVRPKDGLFEVVVGERRYRASQQAGLEKIPVVIHDFTDDEVIELNLIENIQREDLTAVEKAKSCHNLLKKYPKKYPTIQSIASAIDYSEKTVDTWMRTLELPEGLQKYIAPKETYTVPEGKVDYKTVLKVAKEIESPKVQQQVVREIAEQRFPKKVTDRVIEEVSKSPEKPIPQVIQQIMEEPSELQFRLKHIELIKEGIKTQTSRKGIDYKIKENGIVYATIWEPKVIKLKVKKIERKKLGNFTEDDAKREGGYTLEQFKDVWEEIHGKGSWEPGLVAYVIHFEAVKDTVKGLEKYIGQN